MQARQRLGVKSSWTREGTIFVMGGDSTRHRIEKLSDLDSLGSSTHVREQPAQPVSKKLSGIPQTRRIAAGARK